MGIEVVTTQLPFTTYGDNGGNSGGDCNATLLNDRSATSDSDNGDDSNAWIETYTGKAFRPRNPRIEDIDILDIAHALSMLCRYGGHCRRFYSVAEHSVLISHAVSPTNALWGLLHDATEAYLVDVPKPIKPYLVGYKPIEAKLCAAIALRFNLPSALEPAEVKEADARILHNESKALFLGRPPLEWHILGAPLPNVQITGWQPQQAEQRFLARFADLVY